MTRARLASNSTGSVSTMNTTITHWLAAANGSTDRACGEKPPVGSVANACAAAWYGVTETGPELGSDVRLGGNAYES